MSDDVAVEASGVSKIFEHRQIRKLGLWIMFLSR